MGCSLAAAMLMLVSGLACAEVRQVVPLAAEPFPLQDVRLLEGPFKHAMELDRQYLLSLDCDRLLHNFRVQAGLPSSARPLGGWESPQCELRGHTVGHYLSALAMMYASTGDGQLKDRADYIVAELAKCQARFPSGYLSAFPESFIDRVEAGKQVWAPWYTLHKIYAGLLDVHLLCGNGQALEVLEKAVAWIQSRTDKLTDAQMQRMLANEHGGMNDVLAELAAVTGKEAYLRLAQRFNHQAVLAPLAKGEDRLTGLHANTQFPKILGVARQYELTGRQEYRDIARFFWEVVTLERSYVTGSNSNDELFSPKEELSRHLGQKTAETCNTYNMLKLTRRIFCWDPQAEYGDYYERALLNHILASQHPESGMMLYYLPLRSGDARVFSTPNDSFWCCVGTGMENHARYGESIYFRSGDTLYVNLFIGSELQWKQQDVVVRQETRFPESDTARLIFKCRQPRELTVRIRWPHWATTGFSVAVNGQRVSLEGRPSSFVQLRRRWSSGDELLVQMPMSIRTEGFRDNPRKRAVFFGPVLLCTPVEPGRAMPVIVCPIEAIPQAIRPTGRPLEFQGQPGTFRCLESEKGLEVALVPFYKEYRRPYHVYWDVLSESEWESRCAEYRAESARQKALTARTVDRVVIGDQASERAHRLQGEKHSSGLFGGRHWRHAPDGWFSYELQVPPDGNAELLVTYWGSDVGARVFDILVDGTPVATQKLDRNQPNRFFDQLYPIPPQLTKGKQKVTVRFQAHPGNIAGGVFDLRVLRAQ